jgi:hypothetical protein
MITNVCTLLRSIVIVDEMGAIIDHSTAMIGGFRYVGSAKAKATEDMIGRGLRPFYMDPQDFTGSLEWSPTIGVLDQWNATATKEHVLTESTGPRPVLTHVVYTINRLEIEVVIQTT